MRSRQRRQRLLLCFFFLCWVPLCPSTPHAQEFEFQPLETSFRTAGVECGSAWSYSCHVAIILALRPASASGRSRKLLTWMMRRDSHSVRHDRGFDASCMLCDSPRGSLAKEATAALDQATTVPWQSVGVPLECLLGPHRAHTPLVSWGFAGRKS